MMNNNVKRIIGIALLVMQIAFPIEARVTNPIFYNPVSNASGTGAITTTSGTDALMTGLTLTPPVGTYHCQCDSTFSSNSNNADVIMNIYVGGVIVPSSEKSTTPQIQGGVTPSLNIDSPITTMAEVTVNGSQAIECRWRRTAGTGTSTNRTIHCSRIR